MSKNKILVFFVGVNENSTTFLYTLNKGNKKTEGEKSFLFQSVYQSRNFINKKIWYLVLVFGFSLSNE